MRDMVGQVQNEQRELGDVASEYLTGAGIL
jgi:hypothetical protein